MGITTFVELYQAVFISGFSQDFLYLLIISIQYYVCQAIIILFVYILHLINHSQFFGYSKFKSSISALNQALENVFGTIS